MCNKIKYKRRTRELQKAGKNHYQSNWGNYPIISYSIQVKSQITFSINQSNNHYSLHFKNKQGRTNNQQDYLGHKFFVTSSSTKPLAAISVVAITGIILFTLNSLAACD